MWVVQVNYGYGHGYEDECVEPSCSHQEVPWIAWY
jgi:hypothetical protein